MRLKYSHSTTYVLTLGGFINECNTTSPYYHITILPYDNITSTFHYIKM